MARIGPILFVAAVTFASAQEIARGKFLATSDGVQLHYLEAGRGDAILFVPGFTGAADFWELQIRAFSTSHRVVALDPRSAV
jgi:non-heme chloroperoxidase